MLVPDESVMESEAKMTGLDTLVRYFRLHTFNMWGSRWFPWLIL